MHAPAALITLFGAALIAATPVMRKSPLAATPVDEEHENELVPRAVIASQSSTYINDILTHHNIHRTNHTSPPIVWNATLAPYAQIKANTCIFDHSQPKGLTLQTGQNIAQGTWLGPANVSVVVSDLWYNYEFANYAYISKNFAIKNPDWLSTVAPAETWGHLTQLTWNTTTSVACGTSPPCDPYSGPFTVCLYWPPGNYLGNFQNVHKPAGYPTVHGAQTKI